MSARQPSPRQHELLSRHDQFLTAEFSRIKDAPEYQPDESGEYTELVINLKVAVDKTEGGNVVLSLERVCCYLARNGAEIRVPQSLNAGSRAMTIMRVTYRA